jgi:putative phage-type endonuclease
MDRDTWLQFRRTKIGASDASAILSLSPWKTPYKLWREKIYGEEDPINPSMQRGIDMESVAREKFEKLTGLVVMPKMLVHPQRDWQMATLDGITLDGESIVEIKCPNAKVHSMAKDGKLPDYYMCQVQHQMSVAEVDMAFYYSFDGEDGALVEVKRDEAYIEEIVAKESEFFNFMQRKIPPELSKHDYVLKEDQKWAILACRQREILEKMKILEEEGEEIKQQLIAMADGLSCMGSGIRVAKRHRLGLINYKNIPELMEVNLEQYRKSPIEYWEISTCK